MDNIVGKAKQLAFIRRSYIRVQKQPRSVYILNWFVLMHALCVIQIQKRALRFCFNNYIIREEGEISELMRKTNGHL